MFAEGHHTTARLKENLSILSPQQNPCPCNTGSSTVHTLQSFTTDTQHSRDQDTPHSDHHLITPSTMSSDISNTNIYPTRTSCHNLALSSEDSYSHTSNNTYQCYRQTDVARTMRESEKQKLKMAEQRTLENNLHTTWSSGKHIQYKNIFTNSTTKLCNIFTETIRNRTSKRDVEEILHVGTSAFEGISCRLLSKSGDDVPHLAAIPRVGQKDHHIHTTLMTALGPLTRSRPHNHAHRCNLFSDWPVITTWAVMLLIIYAGNICDACDEDDAGRM